MCQIPNPHLHKTDFAHKIRMMDANFGWLRHILSYYKCTDLINTDDTEVCICHHSVFHIGSSSAVVGEVTF